MQVNKKARSHNAPGLVALNGLLINESLCCNLRFTRGVCGVGRAPGSYLDASHGVAVNLSIEKPHFIYRGVSGNGHTISAGIWHIRCIINTGPHAHIAGCGISEIGEIVCNGYTPLGFDGNALNFGCVRLGGISCRTNPKDIGVCALGRCPYACCEK